MRLFLYNLGFLLPFFFAGAGLCVFVQFLLWKFKVKRKREAVRENLIYRLWITLFCGYLLALLAALFHDGVDSGKVNLIPFLQIADYFTLIGPKTGQFVVYFFGNVFCFTPLAFMMPIVFPRLKWGYSILICACSSVLAELIQHFLMRYSDIDDVILNTLGALIGAILFALVRRCNPELVRRWQGKTKKIPKWDGE